MDENPNVPGFTTRIDLARAAVASMLAAYESVANVNVLVVDFSVAAANSGWLSSGAEANIYLAGLDAWAKLLLNSLYGKFGQRPERLAFWFHGDPLMPEGSVPLVAEDPKCPIWVSTSEVDSPFILPQVAAIPTSLASLMPAGTPLAGLLPAATNAAAPAAAAAPVVAPAAAAPAAPLIPALSALP